MNREERHVLIVEDDSVMAEIALRVFHEPPAWRTFWVMDGEAALRFLYKETGNSAAWDPDLILLDNFLPKRTGLTVLEKIKTHPRLRVIPVVIWAIGDEEEALQAYELGAAAYIRKPPDLAQLAEQVRQIKRFWEGALFPVPR
ncbi:MAG: response regulator [Candidatus Bipolaricaulota bacterium]|nr:response regulator [Candidatus Bipolaricaulota bacterium]